ncbi:MAG: 2,3-bisphosphoglycerate-independent phosphoglycerate mutase [Deltaproteobacteria bacterium]|nr:2,3-bisphosphoglycerate-independent phosphoglycerate mutase [Deltaproteobacteria bacterium]MBT5087842.1 2,3-bisphosphoglycerate-independent phosphoglycerate mutase [Deltaproteobacteria bacterium]
MLSLKNLQQYFSGRGPLIHVVLDGWGVGAADETNAVNRANLPVISRLIRGCPYTQLWTHGKYVGLPNEKDMGGSEVGHMTMGAGMVMEQGPTLIQNLLQSGEFFENPVLSRIIQNCVEHDTPLHLLGLLSNGNIHSHVDHTEAIIRHAFQSGIRRCYLHALLDGRDAGVQSALDFTEPFEKLFSELKGQRPGIDYAFASGGGREVITMDRDNNWKKIETGWRIHVQGQSENQFPSIRDAIEYFRKQNPEIIDQDIPGFVIIRNGEAVSRIEDQHALIFTNFRGDRATQFSRAFLADEFPYFERYRCPEVLFAGMTQYDQDNQIPPDYLVGTPVVEEPFGKRILELGLKQFRLSETQKFAHVTFFYNGGYREPLDPLKENYHFIASDKIPSFAERPAMKASGISKKAVEFINSGEYQYGLINFANADMVGHTGDFQATVRAVEAVDSALDNIVRAIDAVNGLLVITADHGNADEMLISNQNGTLEISAKHSLNPVPFLIYDPLYNGDYRLKPFGQEYNNNLSNIAATNFLLLGQAVPDDLAPSLFED